MSMQRIRPSFPQTGIPPLSPFLSCGKAEYSNPAQFPFFLISRPPQIFDPEPPSTLGVLVPRLLLHLVVRDLVSHTSPSDALGSSP